MHSRKNILAISGSTKRNSTNSRILYHIASRFEEHLSVEVFEDIDQLPHFNPEHTEDPPQVVSDFRKKIQEADGVIICTPEYVFSLPGVLKNAIEWTVSTTVFSGKPVAIVVSSTSGQKAFESLDLVMTTIESVLPDEAKLLISGAKGKVGPDGTITDEQTVRQIDRLVDSLIKSMEQKAAPTKYRNM